MTVQELISKLEDMPPSAIVFFKHRDDEKEVNYAVVSDDGEPDEEGNMFDDVGDYANIPPSAVLLSMETL